MTATFPKNETIYPTLPSGDSDNRDPYGINKHLQLDFYNVIAEPDKSTYNFEFLHTASLKLYQYTKLIIYRLLAILVGLPLTICWGLIMGAYAFFMIWIAVPSRRLSQSITTEAGLYIQTISDAMLTPIFRSYGQMFSSIRVTLSDERINLGKQIQV